MSSGHVSAERHAADVQIAKEIDTGPHAGTGTGIHYAESVADRDAHTHTRPKKTETVTAQTLHNTKNTHTI